MEKLSIRDTFVSAAGGTMAIVRDGEVLFEVAVPPGRVPVRQFWEIIPQGADVELSDGLVVLGAKPAVHIQEAPDRFLSAANPDYVPTSASHMEKQLRVLVEAVRGQARTLKGYRVDALAAAQRQGEGGVKPQEPGPQVVE